MADIQYPSVVYIGYKLFVQIFLPLENRRFVIEISVGCVGITTSEFGIQKILNSST